MRISTIAVLAALLLSGCTSDTEKGLCPSAAILTGTAALTVFREGTTQDPSNVLYTVWMTDLRAACEFDKPNLTTDSSLRVVFHAKRAPSTQAASYRVPYFMAVTQGGDRIMTKRLFFVTFNFEPGEETIRFEDKVDSTVIKRARGNKIGNYQILAGMQLTHDQLDYNKRTNNYTP